MVRESFNHVEWPTESLNARAELLADNMLNIKYSGERLEQVQREIALIAFELTERYRENKGISIEQAYSIDNT